MTPKPITPPPSEHLSLLSLNFSRDPSANADCNHNDTLAHSGCWPEMSSYPTMHFTCYPPVHLSMLLDCFITAATLLHKVGHHIKCYICIYMCIPVCDLWQICCILYMSGSEKLEGLFFMIHKWYHWFLAISSKQFSMVLLMNCTWS